MFVEIISIATFLLVCFVFFLIGDAIAVGHRSGRKKSLGLSNQGSNYYKSSKVGIVSRALAGVIPQTAEVIAKIEVPR